MPSARVLLFLTVAPVG